MHKIFKYELEPTDQQILQLPYGAQILDIQVQGGAPFVWAMVNPDAKLADRKFVTVGTGHEIKDGYLESLKYIGTYQISGGVLIFHVFEEIA